MPGYLTESMKQRWIGKSKHKQAKRDSVYNKAIDDVLEIIKNTKPFIPRYCGTTKQYLPKKSLLAEIRKLKQEVDESFL